MPEKLAIVFDIDETALSNYPADKEMDFSYDPVKFDQWIRGFRETVIQPTLRIFLQAQKQGVATIFLTGRKEDYRDVTVADLKRLWYDR